jgi:succinate dehydrogenase/fumarate reductase cytochrome b subunit
MDIFLRTIAIIIEVLLLAAIAYAVLNGVRLAAMDLGIKAKYHRAVTLALLAVGVVVLVFFIAHLTTFYPGGGSGG